MTGIITIIITIIIVVQVATGSGLVDEELSALELGRNFHGCMRGLAIGQYCRDIFVLGGYFDDGGGVQYCQDEGEVL